LAGAPQGGLAAVEHVGAGFEVDDLGVEHADPQGAPRRRRRSRRASRTARGRAPDHPPAPRRPPHGTHPAGSAARRAPSGSRPPGAGRCGGRRRAGACATPGSGWSVVLSMAGVLMPHVAYLNGEPGAPTQWLGARGVVPPELARRQRTLAPGPADLRRVALVPGDREEQDPGVARATRIESARGSQPHDGAATSGPPGAETVPTL
jgi:hypothetical protein